MTNHHIAAILFNIATLLDMAQDNIYRVRAYRRAARRILALPDEATAIVARGEDLPLPVRTLMALDGIGPKIAQRLHAELGISTAQDLIAAAERGKIRELYRFGAHREVNLARAARSAVGGLP